MKIIDSGAELHPKSAAAWDGVAITTTQFVLSFIRLPAVYAGFASQKIHNNCHSTPNGFAFMMVRHQPIQSLLISRFSATCRDDVDRLLASCLARLDGAKGLYVDILRQVESRLKPGTLVLADDACHCPEFVSWMRSDANRYLPVPLPGDLEMSMRLP